MTLKSSINHRGTTHPKSLDDYAPAVAPRL